MSAVIDASGLLAFLLGEPGSDVVLPLLRHSAMSAVNVAECCSRAGERGAKPRDVVAAIGRFEIRVVPFDLVLAVDAAELRPQTRHVGVSLGDRACLALARSLKLPIYTGDRRMASLDDLVGVEIRLIR